MLTKAVPRRSAPTLFGSFARRGWVQPRLPSVWGSDGHRSIGCSPLKWRHGLLVPRNQIVKPSPELFALHHRARISRYRIKVGEELWRYPALANRAVGVFVLDPMAISFIHHDSCPIHTSTNHFQPVTTLPRPEGSFDIERVLFTIGGSKGPPILYTRSLGVAIPPASPPIIVQIRNSLTPLRSMPRWQDDGPRR